MRNKPVFQNYKEVEQYLYRQLPMFQRIGKKAFKKDLDNIIALCESLGNPHKDFRSIHIAGTNGKGSVAHILAALLESSFSKTGIYTSPHLKDYRERIKINGKNIPRQAVQHFISDNLSLIEKIKPSFFEISVALAFWWFREQEVDMAIIETGLGGRLDSTNVILPELSVITNIGYDHQTFLGPTLKHIAREKAGIIKPGVPVVIGSRHPETEAVFDKRAEELSAPIQYADEVCEVEIKERYPLSVDYKIYHNNKTLTQEADLVGAYQVENIRTSVAACHVYSARNSGYKFDLEKDIKNIEHVCSRLNFKGRWQILAQDPLIIADGAHNLEGLTFVADQIELTPHDRLHLILGLVMEKDPIKTLQKFPHNAIFYLTKADVPRAMSLQRLEQAAKELGLNYKTYQKPSTALLKAKGRATSKDLIFIGGSLFLVAELV
ncbi:MAG: folylpolyglutamate synthase/dihydrofolate synthase family protein [Saprospiraceae bacterium]|nr:folylpolyglutamate synthase/dihydrofolate synthase family protein [Saprospiraceae bacterium]